MTNNIGLLLTHFFVKENEGYKWNWVKKSIILNKKINKNFQIVLSGHGQFPPKKILDLIHGLHWEKKIRENQIGMGHPHFVLKGFQICKELSCKTTLKKRAFDWIEHDKILNLKLVFCSTNTNFKKKQLSDLIMYGDTNLLIRLWSCNEWDHNLQDGLENLFINMLKIYKDINFFKKEVTLLSSRELGWKTFYDYKGEGPKYWGETNQNWMTTLRMNKLLKKLLNY